MRYQWIIFDADGTLFDYDKAEYSALQRSFTHFGYDYKPEYLALYKSCNKKLWDAFELGMVTIKKLKVKRFELFLDEIGLLANAAEFGEQYLHHLSEGTQLLNGAENMLKDLSGKVGLILMTNGIKDSIRSPPCRSIK